MAADWTAFWQRLPFKSLSMLKFYERLRFCTYKKLLKGIFFKDFVDLGGGSGFIAKQVAEYFGVQGVVVDNNEQAYKVYQLLGRSSRTKYLQKNLFKYSTKHDLVISDGLIEHFSLQERRKLLKQHKKLAKKYVLIFVPKDSWYVLSFLHFKHGYEKHYSKKELIKELRNAGLVPLRATTDFHMHGVLAKI